MFLPRQGTFFGVHRSTTMVDTTMPSSEGNSVWVQQAAIDEATKAPFALKKVSSNQTNATQATDVESCSSSQVSLGRSHAWGWRRGILIETTKGSITVQIEGEQTVKLANDAIQQGKILLANAYPTDEKGNPCPPNDLITLTHLHEPTVVESLQFRYALDQIYTSTGPVLLAVNPFQNVRGLYGESVMRQYWERAEQSTNVDLAPHVYAIADESFRGMMRGLEDGKPAHQSILVSGESGAGKTVTTKFVMKYLAALSHRSTARKLAEDRAYEKAQPSWSKTNSRVPTEYSSSSIEAQVLQSNPILESFGNARTVRNDNSSRFGKFIELQFTATGKLVGAQIETYLLEKVRLVTQSPGERNYHIFYELLSGALDPRELSQYFLAPTAAPADFGMAALDRRDGVSDKDTYRQLRTAMQTLKLDNDEVTEIFMVTAAILHAANLKFVDLPEEECAFDKNNLHLPAVSHLLGVADDALNNALCYLNLTAGNQTFRRAMSRQMAERGLDALRKATYGAIFTYLVRRINDSISCDNNKADASIGVLDIFGFESFTKNSFEQLCINYCNEALQQQFNAFVLRNEQAEYEKEGIQWSFIEFPENQDVLDLIEKRGTGLLSILDDQCKCPGPSDKAFALDVYSKCGGVDRFQASRKQTATLRFSVEHYAGPVEYDTDGFVEKNRDELSKEVTELLRGSESGFVQELADIVDTSHDMPKDTSGSAVQPPAARFRRADSSVGRATVGGQFRRQLKNLRAKIDATSPHYVRCLKPNDNLAPDQFDTAIVAEQLRCGGILEAVRVARAGFTQHYPHNDFIRRYRSLAWKEIGKKSVTGRLQPGHWQSSSSTKTTANSKYVPRPTTPSSDVGSASALSPAEAKSMCSELLKVLHRKIQQQENGESNDAEAPVAAPEPSATKSAASQPLFQAKKVGSSSSKFKTWERKATPASVLPSPKSPGAKWKKGGLTATDYAKVGIQLGKTKVFLRHKTFEVLERIRSRELSSAAIKLNSIFRMYLARVAYIPFRDAYRRELRLRHEEMYMSDDFKETKEQDYGDMFFRSTGRGFDGKVAFGSDFASTYLVDKWMESKIRDAIHNPVPRNEWGKQTPSREAQFRWALRDGLWIKNYDEKTIVHD